jgi:hypothetical protein
MGLPAESTQTPLYFLVRPFLEDLDLVVLFYTTRCRYQCHFCNLPAQSSLSPVSAEDILRQFLFVCNEVRHCLGILDRITLSNEGSMFDESTMPSATLDSILNCIHQVRTVRRVVLETRLEFLTEASLHRVCTIARPQVVDILTGFETYDERIRDIVLGKREHLSVFLSGLDLLARFGCDLTAYVLYKPDPAMSDADAHAEARRTMVFLIDECSRRNVKLTIRLNPMYAARGTPWSRIATTLSGFRPPRLTDVLSLAEEMRLDGVRVYLGLTSEGLADENGTYVGRDDFSREVLREAKLFNRLRGYGPQIGFGGKM